MYHEVMLFLNMLVAHNIVFSQHVTARRIMKLLLRLYMYLVLC